jgi:polar amino acid transport system substrate-binding protein
VIVSCTFLVSNQSHAGESLKIGSDEWPPFHSAGESEEDVQGFAADLMRAVLKKMGVKITSHRIYPWKRAIVMVFSGDLDVVFTTTKTDERMKYCYFPKEPLTTFSYLFFIRQKDDGRLIYNTFDDLKGNKIGIVRGFTYTEEFMNFIMEKKNFEEAMVGYQNFKKLVANRVDYVVAPKRVGNNLIKKLKIGDKCVALKKPLMENYLYAMFSKITVTQKFVDKFSKALQDLKTTREYEKIVVKNNWE